MIRCVTKTIREEGLLNKDFKRNGDKGIYIDDNIPGSYNTFNRVYNKLVKSFGKDSVSINRGLSNGKGINIHPTPQLVNFYKLQTKRLEKLKALELEKKSMAYAFDAKPYSVKDGEIVPYIEEDLLPLNDDNTDDIKNYNELYETITNQLKTYDLKLRKVTYAIRHTNDLSKLKKLNRSKDTLLRVSDVLKDELARATKVKKLEDLRSFAETHINRVKALISDNMTSDQITEANQYIALWIKAGDFSEDNIFFTTEELSSDNLKYGYTNKVTGEPIKGFNDFRKEMEELKRELDKISKNNIVKWVNETLKTGYSKKEILGAISDINAVTTKVLDLSRLNDPLVTAVYKLTKRTSFEALDESTKLYKKIDKLIDDVKPTLEKYKRNGDLYDLFMQRDSLGNQTGNLVFRFNQSYYDKSNSLYSLAKSTSKEDKKYKQNWNKYFKWVKNNNITFDPRILFPTKEGDNYHYPHKYSDKIQKDLIAELKSHLGEKGFEFYYNQAKKDVEHYKLQYESRKDDLTKDELELWDKENSPYWHSKMAIDGIIITHNDKVINPRGNRFTQSVPRAFDTDGNSTKWYDDNYKIIESNDNLLSFYEEYIDTLHKLSMIIPADKRKSLQANTLPTVAKHITEEMQATGLKGGLAHMYDSIIKSTRVDNLSEMMHIETDAFGMPIKKTALHIADNKKLLNDVLKVKVLKFKADNSRSPTKDEYFQLKSEARNELSNEKSHDLGKILKAYGTQLIAYKHKTKTEDVINQARLLMSNRDSVEISSLGTPLLNSKTGGVAKTGKKLNNYMDVLDNHIDIFLGINKDSIEGKTKIKPLTSKEKIKKKELEESIDNLDKLVENKTITKKEATDTKNQLNEQIDNLGGVVTGNKLISRLLSYVQLKGMGWNIPSAFANMAFGDIANLTLASDGRILSMKSFLKARKLVLHSSLKATGIPTDTSIKISNWMKKLDISKDSSEEFLKHKSLFSKRLALLNPYDLQKKSEFIVQAPVLIGMMIETKVVKDGEVKELWDIIDKDGNLEEGYTLENDSATKIDFNFMTDFKIRVDQVIKKTHGNYDHESPITIKASSVGKLVSQFKTWLYEGMAIRFEGEKRDDILKLDTKGRYRSFAPAFSSVENTIFTLKQLFRKVTFMGTEFDKKFTAVDAANMRANLTELVILMNLYLAGAILSGLRGDKEEDNLFILNFLTNQAGRLQTDVLMYSDPTAYEKLQSNIIPAASVLSEIKEWFEAVELLVKGKDILKSGPDKGDSRLLKRTLSLAPGGAAYVKMERSADRVFK